MKPVNFHQTIYDNRRKPMKILKNLNRTTRHNGFPNSKRLTNNLIVSA